MNRQAVAQILSDSIIRVAQKEFQQLSNGLDGKQQSKYIDSSLKALGDLRHGRMPNYSDRWVALFYATWFQPRQINIA